MRNFPIAPELGAGTRIRRFHGKIFSQPKHDNAVFCLNTCASLPNSGLFEGCPDAIEFYNILIFSVKSRKEYLVG